jgi:hypothetical protein
MVLIPQIKDKNLQTGLKSKIKVFVAYKKHTSLTKTNTDLNGKGRKIHSKQMVC